MSQAPVWITESGSLGVVPEGKFYRVRLQAEDPDYPGDPTKVSYYLIAGKLPEGVQVNTNGIIEGIPVSVADFKGVPAEVSKDTTSKFAIRVIDTENRVADRTFTLTVTGQDKPKWITPPGEIGQWVDGSRLEFQFEAEDVDTFDVLSYSLISGELPPGLTLTSDGFLSGVIQPAVDSTIPETPGFDRDNTYFDQYPFDYTTQSIDKNYEFKLGVSDGKETVIREFSIFVYSRDNLTADNTNITSDNTNITADSGKRGPYLENYQLDLGRYRHDNYFAYQFIGRDFDGEDLKYYVVGGSLPGGLILDEDTGWLYGYLPNIGLTEQSYTFNLQISKAIDPTVTSEIYPITITIYGNIETDVAWITDSNLGTINNGSISTFYVEAQHKNFKLLYRLKEGEYNKLPQGLRLQQSGNIVGRVSFKTFSLDGGTTTFDSEHSTRLDSDPTTFDLSYRFVVEAYSSDGSVSVDKEFTILVNREYDEPQNIIYCKAMPPREDRELINDLLYNRDIIIPEIIYRDDDPYFGSAKDIIYAHAYGLTVATLDDYFAALEKNHYRKRLILGELKTARALDDNGNVMYEVVYSEIIDDLVNNKGESVSKELNLKYPVVDNSTVTYTVYPNSLTNMRNQVIDQIGQQSKILPRWMLSKQENGEILGFTPAWVLAYTKPGKSKFLQYRIKEKFGTKLNLVDFDIDRYTLDAKMSEFWDLLNQRWIEGKLTTFDREDHTSITADRTDITADSTDYTADQNNQTITTDPSPYAKPKDIDQYDNQTETIFDGGSCRFTSPVDVFDASDKKNKYVMFSKEKIINNT